ncbi:HAMP domain-containing sensor histidine kinase [uncultured Pelagimonas sp.]|uniref:sensor histidine kinase n=1 Tax=uncultured Pelagimonas sp. TaxID=1618102 RepID=UPI0026229059|nr:HAMP domain-containing sensor histidine kinase [uncultured Pelagimonas sp.]
MMRSSTTRRIIVIFATSVVIVQLLGFAVQYVTVNQVLNDRLERLVTADLQGFAALYDQRRVIAVRQAIEFRLSHGAEKDVLLSLHDRDKGELAGNVGDWGQMIDMPAETQTSPVQKFTYQGRSYLGVVRVLRGNFPLLVARSTSNLEDVLAALQRRSTVFFLVVLAVSVVAAVIANAIVLKRITRINSLADRVGTGDLSARLEPHQARDEYALLEQHINQMLDKIEALTRSTHHLSDTIAHELRTPLTRIRNRLEQLDMQDANTQEALAELRRTIQIFDSQLQIAKAEAGRGETLELVPLNLSHLCVDLTELYTPLAQENGMTLNADIGQNLSVLGDRNLVAQLLSNLLENAVKFCPKGAEISVFLTALNHHHCLTISDTGPGLPDGFSDQVFDRFSRARPDAAGHGLGMALVQAIALRHGAKLHIPVTEKGFEIQIHWPTLADRP